jgi:hypothetical protein
MRHLLILVFRFQCYPCIVLSLIPLLQIIFLMKLGVSANEYRELITLANTEKNVNRNDTLEELFPELWLCLYTLVGPSGTVQTNEILCTSSTNNINEVTQLRSISPTFYAQRSQKRKKIKSSR